MSKGVQMAGGATAIALLLAWYAVSNLDSGARFTYYQDLAELRSAGGGQTGEALRVHGYVALGSIERDVPAKQVRFAVQNDPPHAPGAAAAAAPLAVVFRSLETPDLFKDGAEVVVEGRLSGPGADAVFHADKVLAKCPSKFQARPGESAS